MTLSPPSVNQSTIIFAFLAFAFLVFITVRGELRAYMGFLLSPPQGVGASPATGTNAGGVSQGTEIGNSGVTTGQAFKAGADALAIGAALL